LETLEEKKRKIKQMLDELNTDNLSDWEESFVASISDQFSHKESLSDKQFLVLESIYRKNLGL